MTEHLFRLESPSSQRLVTSFNDCWSGTRGYVSRAVCFATFLNIDTILRGAASRVLEAELSLYDWEVLSIRILRTCLLRRRAFSQGLSQVDRGRGHQVFKSQALLLLSSSKQLLLSVSTCLLQPKFGGTVFNCCNDLRHWASRSSLNAFVTQILRCRCRMLGYHRTAYSHHRSLRIRHPRPSHMHSCCSSNPLHC